MPWLLLVIAGVFEVGFTTSLKLSEGFTKLWPTLLFIVCAGISFWLLTLAMKSISIGTAYAVFTGIGAFGTAIVGMIFFKDSVTFWRLFFLFMIVASVVGLKIVTIEHKPETPAVAE